MKKFDKIIDGIKKLTEAFARFPMTAIFLIAVVILNGIDINRENTYFYKYLITFGVGAAIGAVVEIFYEHFCFNKVQRIILTAIGTIMTIGYYLIIMSLPRLGLEMGIKTFVAIFALFISFIWIPSIKSKLTFNESFMASFKSFFISLFFAVVLFAGTSLIVVAVNELLFPINEKIYLHTANIIFLLFTPMFFLSLIPVFIGKLHMKEEPVELKQRGYSIGKSVGCPKYLDILLSYVIIPMSAIFTVILFIYIVINISRKFWTNNLLEPMIVIYSISVIILYILTSVLMNPLTELYRKIFPKVFVLIVLFQTIASIIKIGDVGITHNRYFVILYGVFATLAGLLFCFLPVRKNGIIAAILIVFSVISIVPPVDAFTISRISQMNKLKMVLVQNNMLTDNGITRNDALSQADKEKIIQAMNYLNSVEYMKHIPWLPADFDYYSDFHKTFGFYQYEQKVDKNQYVNINIPMDAIIPISGYDYFTNTNIAVTNGVGTDETIGKIEKEGKVYTLIKVLSKESQAITLKGQDNQEIISLSVNDIWDKYIKYSGEVQIEEKDAVFTKDNDGATITAVLKNLNINRTEGESNYQYYSVDLYILVRLK